MLMTFDNLSGIHHQSQVNGLILLMTLGCRNVRQQQLNNRSLPEKLQPDDLSGQATNNYCAREQFARFLAWNSLFSKSGL